MVVHCGHWGHWGLVGECRVGHRLPSPGALCTAHEPDAKNKAVLRTKSPGVTLIGPAFSDCALAHCAATLVRALQPLAGALKHPLGPAPRTLAAPPAASPMRIVAVGAHMSGLALNWQLQERAARLVAATRTAPVYQLYSLTGHTPTRPGLVHVGTGQGRAIDVEVWEMDARHVGSFLALIGAPLALGTVELADGSSERGFVCEPRGVATTGALDITEHGGWRGFLASLATRSP